jgi:hypothetical protein
VKTELSSSQYSEFVGLIKVYKTDKDINRFSVRIRELFEKPGLTICLDGNHTNLYFELKNGSKYTSSLIIILTAHRLLAGLKYVLPNEHFVQLKRDISRD